MEHSPTAGPEIQCEALIRSDFLSVEDRLRGRWYVDALPTSNTRCSRAADGDVFGVQLCWQHRRQVTRRRAGEEEPAVNADEWFASWGVERRGPFVAQM
jgi:hypothetical protein